MADALRRRRAAAIAGYARVSQSDPDELTAMRRAGGKARAAQTRGDSSWGRYLAECKRLKRAGRTPSRAGASELIGMVEKLTARLAALEGNANGTVDTVPQAKGDHDDESVATRT